MKNTIRIVTLMLLIVLSALASNSSARSSRICICTDVYDPYCDATGHTFSNACFCQCSSTQPTTCKRCSNTLR
jgi:hypothetical protein